MNAEQLTRMRQKRGWTQMRLAEELEVTRGAVSRWEAGQRAISRPMARLITLLLNRRGA